MPLKAAMESTAMGGGVVGLATDQLSILPSDADEQLELAHRITLHAFQQKASSFIYI